MVKTSPFLGLPPDIGLITNMWSAKIKMGQKLVSLDRSSRDMSSPSSQSEIVDFSIRWAFGPSRAATSSKLRLADDKQTPPPKSHITSTRTSLWFEGGCSWGNGSAAGRGGTISQGGRINMQDTGQVKGARLSKWRRRSNALFSKVSIRCGNMILALFRKFEVSIPDPAPFKWEHYYPCYS